MIFKTYYFAFFILVKLLLESFNTNSGILNFNGLFVSANSSFARFGRGSFLRDYVNTKKNKRIIENIKKRYGGDNKKGKNNKKKDNQISKECDL